MPLQDVLDFGTTGPHHPDAARQWRLGRRRPGVARRGRRRCRRRCSDRSVAGGAPADVRQCRRRAAVDDVLYHRTRSGPIPRCARSATGSAPTTSPNSANRWSPRAFASIATVGTPSPGTEIPDRPVALCGHDRRRRLAGRDPHLRVAAGRWRHELAPGQRAWRPSSSWAGRASGRGSTPCQDEQSVGPRISVQFRTAGVR